MKNSFLAGLAAVAVLLGAGLAAAQTSSMSGVITASQIASTGSVGIWEKHLNCHGEADCSQRLVAAGGKYVLMTAKGTYTLSDQAKAAQFAGRTVTVAGNFNAGSKTVQVADVQPFSGATVAGVQ